uniref:Uncharacterized protein n=2 Tax=Micrurus carvalhoi TaxID=3147026 RepID=A0A2H6N9C7_9SAUR
MYPCCSHVSIDNNSRKQGSRASEMVRDSRKNDLSDHQVSDVNVIKVLFYNLCQLVLIKRQRDLESFNPSLPKVFSIRLHVDPWFSLVKKGVLSYKSLLLSSSHLSNSHLLRCCRFWELAETCERAV